MKNQSTLTLLLAFGLIIISCTKDTDRDSNQNVVSESILKLIADQGFSTEGVLSLDEGYLIEGDIIMTEEDLMNTSHQVRVPTLEQYHTFNTVSKLPRVITIGFDAGTHQTIIDATVDAAARYNSENLSITFQVNSTASSNNSNNNSGNGNNLANMGPPENPGGGNGNNNGGGGGKADQSDITVSGVNSASYLASAGFPSRKGDPYKSITVNQGYLIGNNWQFNTIVSIMAHEIGHCIGYRHTDWYDRSISCGSGGNEGQETYGVGAVHVPGTPDTSDPNADPGSWMLSCIGNGNNRPFTPDDRTALNYLYD